MLPDDLMTRLRARAADPKTRSDTVDAIQETLQDMAGPAPGPTRVSMGDAAGSAGFGELMRLVAGSLLSGRGFNPQALAEQVAEEVRTGKRSMEDVFGGARPGVGMEIYENEVPSDTPRDLLPPASEADIAAAESTLGFALPEDLKQLYTGIANGGFGPGAGFSSLAELADRYREYRSEPQGPCDETWPEHLLPIVPIDMGDACYDLKTGNIVRWNCEELVDEDMEEEAWDRSFVPWAESLADWLETWLAQKPMSAQIADQYERSRIDSVRAAIQACRDMTPEKRSELGLPDDGWEEQICRNHGVEPNKVL